MFFLFWLCFFFLSFYTLFLLICWTSPSCRHSGSCSGLTRRKCYWKLEPKKTKQSSYILAVVREPGWSWEAVTVRVLCGLAAAALEKKKVSKKELKDRNLGQREILNFFDFSKKDKPGVFVVCGGFDACPAPQLAGGPLGEVANFQCQKKRDGKKETQIGCRKLISVRRICHDSRLTGCLLWLLNLWSRSWLGLGLSLSFFLFFS